MKASLVPNLQMVIMSSCIFVPRTSRTLPLLRIRPPRQSLKFKRQRVFAASPTEDAEASETPVSLTKFQLDELFQKFPQKDGKYDLEAISVLEKDIGVPVKEWFPESEIDQIFKQGYVTFDQFSRLCEANLILEGKLTEYREAFDAVDTSGNGSIGFDELYHLLHFLGTPLSDAKITQMMVDYDLDKSGQIEFNEFMLMFQDHLLDLREVLRYTKEVERTPPSKTGLIRLNKGEVAKIFSEAEFDEILDRNPERLISLFAGLTWCRPCNGMNRPYERFAEMYPDVIFLKFFGNANSSTKHLFIQRLKAEATPAFFFFKNKELIHSHTGKDKEKFEGFLKQFM